MTAALLFSSTAVLVFFLGVQQLNVQGGHHALAAITSLAIGGSQLALYKLAPTASGPEIAAYLTGGPVGIMAAMWAHPRLVSLYINTDTAKPRS